LYSAQSTNTVADNLDEDGATGSPASLAQQVANRLSASMTRYARTNWSSPAGIPEQACGESAVVAAVYSKQHDPLHDP
jgi:hypothetical protein